MGWITRACCRVSKRPTSAELLHCGLGKIDLKDTHHGYGFSFVIPRREDMALYAPSTIQTLGSRRDWGRNVDTSAGKPVRIRPLMRYRKWRVSAPWISSRIPSKQIESLVSTPDHSVVKECVSPREHWGKTTGQLRMYGLSQ